MNWTQAIIVYAVCWWLLLFMALPFGVKSQAGQGAPQKTYLAIKCAIVTLLAAMVTWGIDLVVGSGIVSVK